MDNLNDKSAHIYVLSIYVVRIILWIPALVLCKFFLRMEVRGKDNLKKISGSSVIFAANHVCDIDSFAFQYIFSFFSKFIPLYFVSLPKSYYSFKKYGIRSFFYGGLFFKLMGAYPVCKGVNNFEKALRVHIKILENRHSLLMFPEGRKNGDSVGVAHPGVIFLAKKTNAVVVPVKITGISCLDVKSIIFRKEKLIVTFGSPIEYNHFKGVNKALTVTEQREWANFVMREINNL